MKRIRTILDDLRDAKHDLQSDLYKIQDWRIAMEKQVAGLEHRCFIVFHSDWRRRRRWMILGALAGGAVVALLMLAPVDWIIGAVGYGLILWAFALSWRSSVKTMSILLGYLLVENTILFALLMARAPAFIYSRFYYWPGIVEGLLISCVALEIGIQLVPAHRRNVIRYGPAVLAVPAFSVVAMGDRLLSPLVCARLAELSLFGSICLLCLCIAMADEGARAARLARCYVYMLALVGGSSEILSLSGMAGRSELLASTLQAQVLRRIVPVSWVAGTAVLVWALRGSKENAVIWQTDGSHPALGS